MASIRPVGVLGRSVGHPALEQVDRLGQRCLKLFKCRALRLIRLDNCAISLMRQSVTPAVWPAQRPLLTSALGG
jgi:hypothetical protein